MFTHFLLSSFGGWDVSVASYASKNFDVSAQDTALRGIYFKEDGYTLYIVGSVSKKVFQYTLSTAWDVSTAIYASKSKNVSSEDTFPSAIFFKYDGSIMYLTGEGNKTIYQYTLSTSWDISTASYASKSFLVVTQDANPKGIYLKKDGSMIYVVGRNNAVIFQYSLSSQWDISTASYTSKSFSVSSQDTVPTDIFFRPDGKIMYVSGETTNDSIYQYTL